MLCDSLDARRFTNKEMLRCYSSNGIESFDDTRITYSFIGVFQEKGIKMGNKKVFMLFNTNTKERE